MAKNAKSKEKVGGWAFIIGVIIALLIGLFSLGAIETTLVSILIILGLIVGFMNVTNKDVNGILIAAVSLVIVSAFGGNVLGGVAIIGPYLDSIFSAIMTFVVAATIVVALKAVWNSCRN